MESLDISVEEIRIHRDNENASDAVVGRVCKIESRMGLVVLLAWCLEPDVLILNSSR